ncbi:MAG: glycosyltransferase family 39 protein, partial [Bacteroidales bacterium]|nr:glycosyltransferase family 39 protein [Bacteroidales bacterium]
MDLTKIIQTEFSNLQLYWIVCALTIGLCSIILFLNKKPGYSILFLFLAGLILRVFIATLDPFLWTWDEQYHALVAKNMMINPFKPVLVSNPVLDYDFKNWQGNSIWLHKQPFFLWQIALFFKIFGTSEFVLRLPTIIMMSLMTLLIYRIGKLISTPDVAWYGAFLYTFSVFFIQFVSGYQSTDHNDSAFIFYVTLSIWSWVEYIHSHKKRWLILIGLFAGIAILNKWLVGLLVYSGWSLSIFLCSPKNKWFSEHKQMGISLLVTILIALPWQIFIQCAYPNESGYELMYNNKHFFEAVEGHDGNAYYHLYLISNQYGGFLAIFLLIPGLCCLFKSMQNKVFKVGVFTFVIVTYLFYTIAATKMVMFCTIVCPIFFLAFGALLGKVVDWLRTIIPTHISAWIIVILLGFIAYDNLYINQIDKWHSNKSSFWKKHNIDGIINKQIARQIPSKDWVIFNSGG